MTTEIKHAAGTTQIPEVIESAVALEYSFVDALVALDVNVTGVADDGDSANLIDPIRNQVGDYVSAGERLNPDFDAIKKAEPQLIIADQDRHKDMYDDLTQIAPTILVKSFDANYNENLDAFRIIGKAVSKEDKAQEVMKQHEDKINDYKDQISLDTDQTTLPIVVTNDGVVAHSVKTYVGSFLESLDFKPALTKEVVENSSEYMGADYLELDYKQLSEVNPERLFIMVEDENSDEVKALQNSEAWSHVDAVEKARAHFVNRETWAKFRGLVASEDIAKEISELNE
ncbi:ABC transporter substrate-binding protein [Staphylococcus pettenkoferi]|uniref:ABC transporter substrate-binding protein n=2 Tax=Staphylococcus pettenkoferi TaxID=170573 RepID=A0ABT4BN71_9STAP|nr:ABC transporter substrate-binding protein [Staphylococcus pettenkoferi]MCY1563960.1 ABC transporter substrate-binding protein [Staphylococcus pettenkoferi]MCY1571558.1 ABC transporter substrate-binding protein [Staphylococcus pettenkoferi]MCY1583210.1 ABC transporter substrate-binding protein [Staphylococcus pettenkoferi]MCY1592328.1 ABC transporter substrate-binding protein [Staphylococcus pettenkoferi]MCY1596707.1 ABC transporter substrate-binding protein [Staphylococcus pettenkoferi]